MSRKRMHAVLSLCIYYLTACHSPLSRLQLQVESTGVSDSAKEFHYRAELRNTSAVTLWLRGCGYSIVRFEYRDGKRAVGATDFTCDGGDKRVEVLPGATLRDSGIVARYSGAEYVPLVTVSRAADGRDSRVVRGLKFIAP